ncbi:hypothetical protein DFH11DRAFT_1760255 [Phellopilus nigrolimitatus]|nr:hypothetical protein DFH11DRAFT_1760255 [Phellopilus nigrolimitatus]
MHSRRLPSRAPNEDVIRLRSPSSSTTSSTTLRTHSAVLFTQFSGLNRAMPGHPYITSIVPNTYGVGMQPMQTMYSTHSTRSPRPLALSPRPSRAFAAAAAAVFCAGVLRTARTRTTRPSFACVRRLGRLARMRRRATAGSCARATACDDGVSRACDGVRRRFLARVRRLGLARVRQLCPHSHACEGWPPFALARSATLGRTETRTHGARKVRYSGLHERARQVRYTGPFGSTRPRTRKVRYSDSLHTEERAIALARAATRFLSTRKRAPSRSQGPLLFFVPPIRTLRLPWMQSTYSSDGGAAHTYCARKARHFGPFGSVRHRARKTHYSVSFLTEERAHRARKVRYTGPHERAGPSRSQDPLLGFFSPIEDVSAAMLASLRQSRGSPLRLARSPRYPRKSIPQAPWSRQRPSTPLCSQVPDTINSERDGGQRRAAKRESGATSASRSDKPQGLPDMPDLAVQ